MSEKTYNPPRKNFIGYSLPDNPIVVALIAIFIAVNFVVTFWIQIPIPGTSGYFNFGDVTVMYGALLFGPIIGSFAGGIGSMLADVFSPYMIYAPATIIIKGLEGFIIGVIANPKKNTQRIRINDELGVVAGGLLIPIGYFIYELVFPGFGLAYALYGVPYNTVQFSVAAISSLILVTISRKNIIQGMPQVFDKVFVYENK